LFSKGINARLAPLSIASCSGSPRIYFDELVPLQLQSISFQRLVQNLPGSARSTVS
jgi:hypothetical protein